LGIVLRGNQTSHGLPFHSTSSSVNGALMDVRVILVGTKRPVTIGMVARACACFEVGELAFVAPRTKGGALHLKSALRASKGALQHSLSSGLELSSPRTLLVHNIMSLHFVFLFPFSSTCVLPSRILTQMRNQLRKRSMEWTRLWP